MAHGYGIDLGTTYSAIAKSVDGVAKVYQDGHSAELTVPSVVYFDNNGNSVVGRTAKRQLATRPDMTVEKVKRYMEPDPQDPEWKEFVRDFNGKTHDVVSVSAEILKAMGNVVKDAEGTMPADVVITIPAYFGLKAAARTKQAGVDAGFNVLDTIAEPTAAAIYYAATEPFSERKILVIDLGGGTFDVSVLQTSLKPDETGVDRQHMTVLGFAGSRALGGMDWDEALLNIVKSRYADDHGMQLADVSDKTILKMKSEIETLKIELSEMASSTIMFTDSEGNDCEYLVTREDFEAATGHLCARVMKGVDEVLNKIQLMDSNIDCVYMVGGSTMMPMIYDPVVARFGNAKVRRKDPHLAVALGAAIYAEDMGKVIASVNTAEETKLPPDPESEDTDNTDNTDRTGGGPSVPVVAGIVDRLPRSFGFAVAVRENGGETLKLLNLALKDTKLPYNITRDDLSVRHDDADVLFPVYENTNATINYIDLPLKTDINGEPLLTEVDYSKNPDNIVYLGQVSIPTPPGTKAGDRLSVEMAISQGRIMTITATFTKTGITKSGEVNIERPSR